MDEGLTRPESLERFGRNVRVNALYFRHAEKASGTIGSEGKISSSTLSERGIVQSKMLGARLAVLVERGKDGIKIAHSDQARTLETARAMTEAYRRLDDTSSFHERQKGELSADEAAHPAGFMRVYIARWEKNKTTLLEERGMSADDLKKLSPKEQAEIAEAAEEPVMEEWLDNPESELAKLYPIEQAASKLAVLVNRDVRIATRLKSNSEIDFLRTTHKSICEPLLLHILRMPETGGKPKTLADIGGALGLNDGWGIEVQTDAHGASTTSISMYRVLDWASDAPKYQKQKYGLDLRELEHLATLGVAMRLTTE